MLLEGVVFGREMKEEEEGHVRILSTVLLTHRKRRG